MNIGSGDYLIGTLNSQTAIKLNSRLYDQLNTKLNWQLNVQFYSQFHSQLKMVL